MLEDAEVNVNKLTICKFFEQKLYENKMKTHSEIA